jgi:hypothetical protein
MRRFFEKLLRPNRKMLCNAAFVFAPIVLYVLYCFSFQWFFTFNLLVQITFVVLALLFLITLGIDMYFKTRTKRYVLLVAGLLLLFVAVAPPIKDMLVKKSDEQLVLLAKSIDEYRLLYGTYPYGLTGEFFAQLPERSYVGTRFFYDKSANDMAYIRFYSFNGVWHAYDIRRKRHYSYD